MGQSHNKLYALLIYTGLALATIIAFEQVRHNEFVNYDDDTYVTKNPRVNAGVTRNSIIWAFTTPHGETSYWHPLTWLSHMLDCELFGLDAGWHHLTNLLLHTANTLLLFWVLKMMTGAVWQSAFVAAVFALHPLNVESVAWVSERKNVLSTLFWILTIGAYTRYARGPGISRYLLTLLVFALGLTAKPMLVTLPFVLLLLDYWPLERFQWKTLHRLVWEKVPFFTLSAILSVIIFIVQRDVGAVVPIKSLHISSRLSNVFVSYIRYIGKMIYPHRLAVFYPLRIPPIWLVAVAILLLLVISCWVILSARKHKYLAMGWLWYLGTLMPVIGLVQVGGQAMADRYSYLPSIGIFIMVAWGVAELLARWRYRKIALPISAGLVFVVLLLCTRRQVLVWQNDFTLFGHAIAVTENNATMHNNMGVAFQAQGELAEATTYYRQALKISPRYAKAHDNLGRVLKLQGRFDEAISCFRKVLEIKPNHIDAHNNLGAALHIQGKFAEAISHYLEVIKFEPDHFRGHYNIGLATTEQGKYEEAIKHFTKALQLKPDWYRIHNDVAAVYAAQGKLSEATEHYEDSIQLNPVQPYIHQILGNFFYQLANPEKAAYYWSRALELSPQKAEVANNLAWLKAATAEPNLHNPADAVRLAEKACELTEYNRPDFIDTLAIAYAAVGRFPQAIETAEKAIKSADATGQKELAEEIQKRLQLYEAGKPYREK